LLDPSEDPWSFWEHEGGPNAHVHKKTKGDVTVTVRPPFGHPVL